MRLKRLLAAAGVAVGPTLLMSSHGPVLAQAPSVQQVQSQDALLGSIRDEIVQAIGARDATVEVTIVRNTLKVARINSSMNQTSHAARNHEAARIGPIVSRAISGKPELSRIHTIRVQYVARSKSGAYEKTIDIVEFRKDAGGAFQFHAT